MNILTILAAVFQTLAHCVEGAFLLLAQIGRAIFLASSAFVRVITTAGRQTSAFLRILCEDNAFIVTRQIPSLLGDAAAAVSAELARIADLLARAAGAIVDVIAGISRVTSATMRVVAGWATALEAALAFAGETSWLILTFLPVQVPRLAAAAGSEILGVALAAGRAATAWGSGWSITAAAGLTALIWALMLMWRRRRALYWWSWRAVHVAWYTARGTSREWGSPASRPRHMGEAAAGEAACVVCRERHKCVVTLPCRHVCLCRECCDRLCGMRRSCPLCRTFIYRTVDVYL